jgi:hypothetical protein
MPAVAPKRGNISLIILKAVSPNPTLLERMFVHSWRAESLKRTKRAITGSEILSLDARG